MSYRWCKDTHGAHPWIFLSGNSLTFQNLRNFFTLLIYNQQQNPKTKVQLFLTVIDPFLTFIHFLLSSLFIIYYHMEVRIVEAQNEIYQKDKLLGEGAFGKAYLVRKKDTGELLVIKEVSIDHMSQKEQEETIKQAQILRNFKHPLIVRFVEVYATKQNKLKIVMEYAECGDLSKAIAARRTAKKPFEETQILDWFTQICLAMKHVHDRKILHRDIKGQNIFITKANTLKLGDFGIARVLNKTQDKARTVVGTPYYLSPEIIENKPYSFKSDIWSMGVLLYEMCALAPPFNANSLQMLALKIVKGSYSPITANYSKELKGLISEVLHIDPNKRPYVGEILERPFIKQRIQKFLSETNHKIEFSHTILHNHKVQISNKLIKVQNKVQDEKQLEIERMKLKQEGVFLKQYKDKKNQEDRLKEEQKLKKRKEEELKRQGERYREDRLKQEERLRRKREEELRREQDNLKRKQQDIKMREQEQKRALQERKQWIEREKRRQQQEQQRKRVQEIAEYARHREREEQKKDHVVRKEKLQRDRYEIQRRESEMQAQKKKNKEKEEMKKMDDFNEFARKQWFENQMIRKRAEERAKQSELDTYQSQTPSIPEQPQYQRPQSVKDKNKGSNLRDSREKKVAYQPEPKRKSQAYEPSQQELQNALLNPNYNKKTPLSKAAQPVKTPVVPKIKEEIKDDKSKKNYDEAREKIRKDREQFLKGKSHKNEEEQPVETLKPGKWQKRSKSREREEGTPSSSRNKVNSPAHEEVMQSAQLKLNIKDQEELKDYLNELQGLLNNVNKRIEKLEPFPEMPVEKEIILRQDDNQELDYSMTGSFDIALQPPVQQGNADFNLFSDYSKLEELKMSLEEKFGTAQFIKIYRMLENQMQTKGLDNFNILELEREMGKEVDKKLILDNLTMLLTLIVMEERMGC